MTTYDWTYWEERQRQETEAARVREIAALKLEVERLTDKVEGLEADLESAVETAYRRGATTWTRLNYPAIYRRLREMEVSNDS